MSQIIHDQQGECADGPSVASRDVESIVRIRRHPSEYLCRAFECQHAEGGSQDERTISYQAGSQEPRKRPPAAYRINVDQDLWSIEVSYGRIGRRERSVTCSATDDAAAAAIIHHCLHRRATAPKRIGVPYQIRELCDPKDWAGVQIR